MEALGRVQHTPQASVVSVVNGFERRGIHLHVSQGNIAYRALAGTLSAQDKDIIRSRKEELLCYLRALAASKPGEFALPEQPAEPAFYQEVWWHWFKDVPILLPYERTILSARYSNISASALEAAIRRLVNNHDALRMHFRNTDNGLRLEIHPDASGFQLETITVENESDIAAATADFVATSLRMKEEWLAKAALLKTQGGVTYVVLTLNHAICDAASIQIARKNLDNAVYDKPLIESVPYSQFISQERAWFSGSRREALNTYWSRKLSQCPRILDPSTATAFAWQSGTRRKWHAGLNGDAARELSRIARMCQVPPIIVCLAALFIGISKWCGQGHFAIRCVAEGRVINPAFASTLGLMLRHIFVEARFSLGDDLGRFIKHVSEEYSSAVSLSIPTHWEMTGADYRSTHYTTAATFNYFSLSAGAKNSNIHSTSSKPSDVEPVCTNSAEPWPAMLMPFQVRVSHAPDYVNCLFEFNDTAIEQSQQIAFAKSYLGALDDLFAWASDGQQREVGPRELTPQV